MASIEARTNGIGKTSYRVKVRLKGRPPLTATFERKTDAKRWAQDTESRIREGRYFDTAEAKHHTVADMIDRYTKSGIALERSRLLCIAISRQSLGRNTGSTATEKYSLL